MPHLKCVACKTRAYGAADSPGDRCSGCGSPLEPVGALAEVVGFRSITVGDDELPGRHEPVARPVGGFQSITVGDDELPARHEPVARPVGGFRSITARDDGLPATGEPFPRPVGDLGARREARRARAWIDAPDAQPWFDGGDSPRAEAVRLPRPEPSS